MADAFLQLGLFAAKSFIIVFLILFVLIAVVMILAKGKEKIGKGKLTIKNLNKKYDENADLLLTETLPKKQYKKYLKAKKAEEKAKENQNPKNIFVLNFHGDMKASAVASLSEEVTAILNIATPIDEVILRLESPGGVVHAYGLATSQLQRIRDKKIPLTVTVDKVAASGGYLMACTANKILAAPFAIIGSIGVVAQLPNFHRALKDKHIDFEQHTAGEYKRTISLFAENTDEGRKKLQEEIEDIHQLFKNMITTHRPQIEISKVATGEHWPATQALSLKLVDEIKTSDEYLLERSKDATLYEIVYETKKPFLSKFTAAASLAKEKLLGLM